VQDAAYGTMVRPRRRQLHSTIAKVLVEKFPAMAESLPEIVARHFADAGLASEAIAYWIKASRLALAQSANREAVTCFEQALPLLTALPDTRETLQLAIEIRMGLWTALQPLNDRERMGEHLKEAEILTRKLDNQPYRAHILMLLANQFQVAGDY